MPKPSAKEFKCHVIKELFKKESKNNGYAVRVVRWEVDNEMKSAQLEKRDYYIDRNGETKFAKAKGFTASDFLTCLENLPEIINAMDIDPQLIDAAIGKASEKAAVSASQSKPADDEVF